MSLRHKVASILFGAFALFGALDYGVQRFVLAPSFLALEREEVQKNVDRAAQAVLREAELLAPSSADWAVWDDCYRYAADRNRAFADENLTDTALQGLRVNVMALYDTEGRLVWGRSLDLEEETPVQLPDLSGPLPKDHPLLALGAQKGGRAGLYRDGDRLLVVVGHPILTSEGKGPSRGTFLLARFLDEVAFRRVAEQARLRLSARPAVSAGVPAWSGEGGERIRQTAAVLTEDADVTRATTVLGDVASRPVVELQVDTPRDITRRGRTALHYATVSLSAIGLGVLGVLMVALRRTILEPLDQLTQHALAVGERADLTRRLDMRRDDELGTLAREFDGMVGRLAEARRELLEQSYRSGIAETASGVLHNIGNAITPLKVNVAHLVERFRAAPVQDFEQALAELGQPGTVPERRALLGQFVDLAGRELAAVVRAAPEDLGGISRQVEHVQQIVADQERFSRAARVLEPLSLVEVLADSVAVLGVDLRRDLAVQIDPGVAALGRVCGSQAALQQVVVNLLVNAAEAVRASGREAGTGVMAVSGAVEEVDGRAFVHLRFADNGVGIPAENLTRVFDRGFSTKSRKSSGLGLHWSSVTVGSLGGRLFAESEGAGRGACLHLLLPPAQDESAAEAAAA